MYPRQHILKVCNYSQIFFSQHEIDISIQYRQMTTIIGAIIYKMDLLKRHGLRERRLDCMRRKMSIPIR